MRAKRILIVEDEQQLRKASAIALQRAGYEVLTASDGLEGLEIARAELPDLVVLDLMMPAPTGLDVLRTLRAEAPTYAIPVLVVSNSDMRRVVNEVRQLGAEHIVKANLSLRQLVERVGQRLAVEPETPPVAPDPTSTPVASVAPPLPPPPPAASAPRPASPPLPPPARPPIPAPAPAASRPRQAFAPAPNPRETVETIAAAIKAAVDSVAPVVATPVDTVSPDSNAAAQTIAQDAAAAAEPSSAADIDADCAGCGYWVGARFQFCPKCGRKLESARSTSARIRRVR